LYFLDDQAFGLKKILLPSPERNDDDRHCISVLQRGLYSAAILVIRDIIDPYFPFIGIDRLGSGSYIFNPSG
jgi:hypothetical protein